MAKVLVVEDDPTMSEMVAYNLRRHGLEVDVANDGRAGLRAAQQRDVSLVLLDLMLPSLDGIAFAGELRTTRPDVPILMLTARTEERMKLAGFAAGIDDYLTKPFSMDELVARVRVLLRRSRIEANHTDAPDELSFGDMRLERRDHRCWVGDSEIALRPKEVQLLATLASEPGRLFTRVELARTVWGFDYLGDSRTIDTHVKNIRRRIEDVSAFTYIETIRGVGYRFRVQPKTTP